MSSTSSVVYLRDGATGLLVQAELHDSLLQRHLDDHKIHWNPFIVAQGEQHGHWDWEHKWSQFSAQLSYQAFAIECNG